MLVWMESQEETMGNERVQAAQPTNEGKKQMRATKTATAYFNRFAIEMPLGAVEDCSHQGECDEDVDYWATRITRPDEVTAEALRLELKEYGSWDAEELSNDRDNWQRIIWLAAGNLREEQREQLKK